VKNHRSDKTGFCIYKRKHFAMDDITIAYTEKDKKLLDKYNKGKAAQTISRHPGLSHINDHAPIYEGVKNNYPVIDVSVKG
jgi:hypothetical protein